MGSASTLYTTISEGRAHIAAGFHYIGSLNSYNNCFTDDRKRGCAR